MMGSAKGVRFTGKIVQKLDDGSSVLIRVEMPDNDGFVSTIVHMIPSRFAKVQANDTITGSGNVTRSYDSDDEPVIKLAPSIFTVRNARGYQVA
jgi:hypothetical protein